MPAFTAGYHDLATTSILANHTGDRPSFQADVTRGLFTSGHFLIFAMPQGLLFLEMRLRDYGNLGPQACYGGGLAGAAAAWQEGERYGFAPPDKWETGLDAKSEDELLENALSSTHGAVAQLEAGVAERLDVEVQRIVAIGVREPLGVVADGQLAAVAAVAPERMTVADSRHVELEARLESYGDPAVVGT